MFKDLPIKNDSIMTCPCPCHWLPPQDDRVDLGFTRFICVHNPLAWNKRQKKTTLGYDAEPFYEHSRDMQATRSS